MKIRLTALLVVAIGSTAFSQTWLEKGNNGQDYGTGQPPTTITVNPYSEPFDTSWRDGFVGIGTPEWPKTRLQVHSNNNVSAALSAFLLGNLGSTDHTFVSSIFSSGGNAQNPFAGSSMNFTSRSNVSNAFNFGSLNVVEGSNVGSNMGVLSLARGNNNNEMFGVQGNAQGNGNTRNVGIYGIADGDGQTWANFGVFAQCNTQDPNSVNIGVLARGVNANDNEPALVNIGVHGRAECSAGGGGGSQFNCGIYGTSFGCTDSTFGGASYPTGSFAGYFDGNVLITGNLWLPSDEKLKENVKPLERITDRLGKVKTYSYNFKHATGLSLPSGTIEYGVIAQQLEKEFPELVQSVNVIKQNKEHSYRDIETIKTVEYGAFIPLLIQANNELNEKLQSLDPEKTLAAFAALKEKIASLEKNLDNAAVGQNKDLDSYINAYPNPTTSEMTIDVKRLSCNNCVLMITDLSGKLVRQFEIRGTEEKFRLSAADFTGGVYQCNLIADGKVASSIKIAFTKN